MLKIPQKMSMRGEKYRRKPYKRSPLQGSAVQTLSRGQLPNIKDNCPSLCWRSCAGAGSRSSVTEKTFVKVLRWWKATKERNLKRNSYPNLNQVISGMETVRNEETFMAWCSLLVAINHEGIKAT